MVSAKFGYSNRGSSKFKGNDNISKFKFEKSTFILEEDECRVDVNHVTRHVIDGLHCRYSSNSEVSVITGLPTGGFPEEISVIEDIPTEIEIAKDDNSFADSNNSFDDDSNNEIFEHDDHHRKQQYNYVVNKRHDEHDDDNENYHSFVENESDTNFASVCDESQGNSLIYDYITSSQDLFGSHNVQTVCHREASIYDSITRLHNLCGLQNVQTVYREENDHEDDTLHNMCGSTFEGKNDYSVQSCEFSNQSTRSE
eukprot:CAMPEP_0194398758 /NCGR_PEP_ID=MMETSP0174-20130528/126287_1 /TAXON_ID=216777 /ORGANISM="Proboscia alata, Strain PI-D3" /LENGTH=254 /DNA_ID=CAMNT_0039195101 /DNA_START=991 /DNA_END=1753 /DNA_ORIENTATION=-